MRLSFKTILSVLLLAQLHCLALASPIQPKLTQSQSAQKSPDHLIKAEELMKSGQAEAAFGEYQKAIDAAQKSSPERRAARFAFAQALSKEGIHDEAAKQYQAVIEENKGRDAVAYFNLGNSYARIDENEKAIAAYRQAIEQRYGKYSRAHNNLGLVLARLGRLDEARDEYLQAIQQESGHYADAHYNLALLYWRQGDDKSAEKHLAQTRRENPNHEEASILLAQITSGARPEDANKIETVVSAPANTIANAAPVVADKSINPKQEESKAVAPITESTSREALNKKPALESGLSQPLPPSPKTAPPQAPSVVSNPTASTVSVSVSPDSFRLLQQAREARRIGNLEKAANFYRSVLQAEKRDLPPIQWEFAEVLMRLDKPAEASELYRRIITYAGARYPSAYYNLGRAMMGEGKYAGAVVMLKQALTRLGEQSYIYLALSEALERSENINDAVEALNKYALLRTKERTDDEEKGWYERKLASLREKQGKP